MKILYSLRCVHTMPHGSVQHDLALLHGKSCKAYAAKLTHVYIKKEFAIYISVNKNCDFETSYAPYVGPKIKSTLQLSANISAANL